MKPTYGVRLTYGQWRMIHELVHQAITNTDDGMNVPIIDEIYSEDQECMVAVRAFKAQVKIGEGA